MAVTNTFTPGTLIKSSEVNTNFTECVLVNGSQGFTPGTAPTPTKGAIYFDSSEDKLKICEDGSNFVAVGSGVGGLGRFIETFTSQTSVTVTHNLGDLNPVVQVYDSNNEQITPDTIDVLSGSQVQVDFSSSTTGFIAVHGGQGVDVGTTAYFSQSFTSQTSVAVAHGLNQKYVQVQVFDNSDELIIPDSVTLTDADNLTVTFAGSETGKVVVVGGSSATTVYGVKKYTDTFTTTTSKTVSHNLNTTSPVVAVYNSSGEQIFPDVTISDANELVLDFAVSTTGTVEVQGGLQSASPGAGSADFIPNADSTWDLGSGSFRWKDLYLSGSSIDLGGKKITNDGGSLKWGGADIGMSSTAEVQMWSNIMTNSQLQTRAPNDAEGYYGTELSTIMDGGSSDVFYRENVICSYNYIDNVDDASIDPAKWTVSVTGDGAIGDCTETGIGVSGVLAVSKHFTLGSGSVRASFTAVDLKLADTEIIANVKTSNGTGGSGIIGISDGAPGSNSVTLISGSPASNTPMRIVVNVATTTAYVYSDLDDTTPSVVDLSSLVGANWYFYIYSSQGGGNGGGYAECKGIVVCNGTEVSKTYLSSVQTLGGSTKTQGMQKVGLKIQGSDPTVEVSFDNGSNYTAGNLTWNTGYTSGTQLMVRVTNTSPSSIDASSGARNIQTLNDYFQVIYSA